MGLLLRRFVASEHPREPSELCRHLNGMRQGYAVRTLALLRAERLATLQWMQRDIVNIQ
jgi:hypothetical protein